MRNILGFEPRVSISLPVIDMRLPVTLTPPLTFSQVREHAGVQQSWLWDGFLAAGCITMLTSLWKAGKTTLVASLLRALCLGRPQFLGQRLGDGDGDGDGDAPGLGVLVITEEGPGLWAQRLGELPAHSPLHFLSRPFLARPTPERWQQYAMLVAEWAAQRRIGLVVIDPIANLIPGEENASRAMLDFLMPLQAFTRQGLAVLLLHHPRKSDGGEGRAARGSGALPGFVDIVLEMRRPEGDTHSRVRTLTALSRFRETPAQLCIELTAAGDDYRLLDSRPDAALPPLGRTIQVILAAADQPLSVPQIVARWPAGQAPPTLRSVRSILSTGLNVQWTRTGEGTRSSPYRYRAVAAEPAAHAIDNQAEGAD